LVKVNVQHLGNV